MNAHSVWRAVGGGVKRGPRLSRGEGRTAHLRSNARRVWRRGPSGRERKSASTSASDSGSMPSLSSPPSRLSNRTRSLKPFAIEKAMKHPVKTVMGNGNASRAVPVDGRARSSIERCAEGTAEPERADAQRPETKTRAARGAAPGGPGSASRHLEPVRMSPSSPLSSLPLPLLHLCEDQVCRSLLRHSPFALNRRAAPAVARPGPLG